VLSETSAVSLALECILTSSGRVQQAADDLRAAPTTLRRPHEVNERDPSTMKKLFALQAVCNGATIAGALLSFLTVRWWALAIVAFLATIIVQLRLFYIATKTTEHQFLDERSTDFCNFFARWYDQNGTHQIYCNDLDWLDRPEVGEIVNVLIRRSNRVSVYVREDNAAVCQRLRDAGVNIWLRPDMPLDIKMSLRTDDDDKWLIIRRKAPSSVSVTFIETDEPYKVGLAEAVFAFCRRFAQTRAAEPTPISDDAGRSGRMFREGDNATDDAKQ
jgi:hypothetical protein